MSFSTAPSPSVLSPASVLTGGTHSDLVLQNFLPETWLSQLHLPAPDSHKGQNGKLLIIGGSNLFHAASKWSLDIASKFVDMVFYASTPSNNELVKQAKGEFWNGLVISTAQIPEYLTEADVILIGPGMERTEATAELVNHLLKTYPTKKWVVDAGALQMAKASLFTESMILTPHSQELVKLAEQFFKTTGSDTDAMFLTRLATLTSATILYKGQVDQVLHQGKLWQITGGNPGMTKGGTGDVLAGLVAALYCNHEALIACLIGSYANKLGGDKLHQTVGPFFNASDLVATVPETLWAAYNQAVGAL